MALSSSSLTDPGTATNVNVIGDSMTTPDKSKLADYLNKVIMNVLLHVNLCFWPHNNVYISQGFEGLQWF